MTETDWTLFVAVILLAGAGTDVGCSGVFEIEITSLYNSKAVTHMSTCCDGDKSLPPCTKECRTFFSICLMHYQNPAPLHSTCTFGDTMTPVLGSSTFKLRNRRNDPGPYIIRLPFMFSWPESFTLTIEAWHDKHGNRTLRDSQYLIQRVMSTGFIRPTNRWKYEVAQAHSSELHYGYHVTCDTNYYGSGCDRLCKPRNDHFGHYTCDKNGTIVCMSGWEGEYCENAKCTEKCHNSHGFCEKPFKCSCRIGWTGQYCEKCKPYPGCLHGRCHEPWQCICEDGWNGQLCNIDKHYCKKHSPCMNGGTCLFSPSENYTCSCPPEFKGPQCQFTKCHHSYCLNGGLCTEQKTSRHCSCPPGYYGDRCEHKVKSCDEMTCQNHGTCVPGLHGGVCVCSGGFSGTFCETEVDECLSTPCLNGGKCVDEINGYRCRCPGGFAGQVCDIHIGSCLGVSCLNGGFCDPRMNLGTCICPKGFTGSRCEIIVNACTKISCLNGGSCLVYPSTEECVCPRGFTGDTCRQKDLCLALPCKNGGVCRQGGADFFCLCLPQFGGITCNVSFLGAEYRGQGYKMRSVSEEAILGSTSTSASSGKSPTLAVYLFAGYFLTFYIRLAASTL